MKTAGLIVFLLALTLNLAAGCFYGLGKPMESDAKLFLQIAESVADGDGYRLREGFWPDEPTMSRAPGWTLMVAGVLRIFSNVPPDMAMRVLSLFLNAVISFLIFTLARKFGLSNRLACLSSAAYMLYPTALYHAVTGSSEILFVACCIGAMIAVMGDVRWVAAGSALLGAACLVKPNLVILPFAVAAFAMAMPSIRKKVRRHVVIGFAAVVLFLIPPVLWSARNYTACGEFPVLSTLRGQTFYGGNNELVASLGRNWGYWVFPNSVPGETSMLELSETMSELEVDQYYMERGKSYLKKNWAKIPMLCVGKVVRAYVPVPWRWSMGLVVVNGYRLCLYCLIILGAVKYWKLLPERYRLLGVSLLLVNIITVLVFWGCARFAFAIEPVFIPLAAMVFKRGNRSA